MRAVNIPLLAALIVAVVLSAFGQKPEAAYVKGEALVKFRSGTNEATVQHANRLLGAQTIEKLGDLGWVRVRFAETASVDNAVSRYRAMTSVEDAQPNFYYGLLNTPNDPQFGSSGMYGLTKISAPAAWDITTGSSTVVVADIDTGMRYTHEDLAANVWTNPGEIAGNGIDDDGNGFIDDVHGYDFRFNDADPVDENGHGTHTAGTIGAAGNNLLGVVGVNWNVKIMPIKIYSAGGTDSTSAMLVNAYNYVRLMKTRGVNIRVTNNSYGDCPEACGYDQATRDALSALGDAGVLNVFAAGNNASNNDVTAFYPANYDIPTILSVASSDQSDNRSSFSNFGATTVDLAAPGSSILSTLYTSNSSYGTKSGTSMATPHVAGAAALLSSLNPALSAASLKATLMNSVDVLANWNGVVKAGGRMNIARALQNQTVCAASFGGNNSISVPTKGGYFTVNYTLPPNCELSAKSTASWIHISSPATLSGSGSVTFRVAYLSTITRSASINIGGSNLTVVQSRVPSF